MASKTVNLYSHFYYLQGDGKNFMDLLIGTLFLILVLIIFTLFTYKAPNGMRAMGALANAAIATFLVEAFNKYVGGEYSESNF